MDCRGVPTRVVSWMNSPALPILCCWAAVQFWRQILSGTSQGKSGKSFKEHEDLVLAEVLCCQHQGRVSQGAGTWAGTKQKCPSVSDPRRGRSDPFCIAGDRPQHTSLRDTPVWSQAGQRTQTTSLHSLLMALLGHTSPSEPIWGCLSLLCDMLSLAGRVPPCLTGNAFPSSWPQMTPYSTNVDFP